MEKIDQGYASRDADAVFVFGQSLMGKDVKRNVSEATNEIRSDLKAPEQKEIKQAIERMTRPAERLRNAADKRPGVFKTKRAANYECQD